MKDKVKEKISNYMKDFIDEIEWTSGGKFSFTCSIEFFKRKVIEEEYGTDYDDTPCESMEEAIASWDNNSFPVIVCTITMFQYGVPSIKQKHEIDLSLL